MSTVALLQQVPENSAPFKELGCVRNDSTAGWLHKVIEAIQTNAGVKQMKKFLVSAVSGFAMCCAAVHAQAADLDLPPVDPEYFYIPEMIGAGLGQPIMAITNQGTHMYYNSSVRSGQGSIAVPTDRLSLETRVFVDAFFYEDPLAPSPFGDQKDTLVQVTGRLEKTFLDGRLSAELIFSAIDTQSHSHTVVEGPRPYQFEMTGITFGAKYLVARTQSWAASIGALITAPVSSYSRSSGAALFDFEMDNDVWHINPYLALAYTPNANFFALANVGYKFGTSDYTVTEGGVFSHTLNSTDALTADFEMGYWFFNNGGGSFIEAWAPVVGVSYYGTTSDHQFISTGNAGLVNRAFPKVNYITLTGGLQMRIADGSSLAIAGGIELGGNSTFVPPVVYEDDADRFSAAQVTVKYTKRF
jgi:hypothetical protein